MLTRLCLAALLFGGLCLPAVAAESRLLRHPDVSADHIVFAHGGDLWVVDRAGGSARRLTSFPGVESDPNFSPDGQRVAFSGQYDGNTDVYVVAVEGGEPERLTWHPDEDTARGWTNDGSRVIFASGRTAAPIRYPKFWTVSTPGGFPTPMPMPRAWRGTFAPAGDRFAYEPIQSWETEWRNYRGGQNRPVWLLDMDDLTVEKLPWEGSNDSDPVWLGDTIYFLSDRDWAVNVWAYNTTSSSVQQLTRFTTYDAKNLAGGDGVLVFEQGGYIHLLDPAHGEAQRVAIHVRGDFPWARPHWEDVSQLIQGGSLSPTGKRALFEARGDIFTVPADKGDVRNLTASSGTADRAPAWSPDGKQISWFSDASGEYRLTLADEMGQHRKEIVLDKPTFYYTPVWSPDSKHLAFGDADRNLWVVDVATGEARKIDDEGFAHPNRTIRPEWSPDSQWIAYTRRLTNQYNAIHVYSLATDSTHQVTDGMSDSLSPAWDKNGKYLYFLASTDFGLNVGWLDMTSYDRPLSRAVYLVVLAADEPSPLRPESDDETETAAAGGADDTAKQNTQNTQKSRKKKSPAPETKEADQDEGKKTPTVVIDFDGLDQRIISIDVPARRLFRLQTGTAGSLFYAEFDADQATATLYRYSLEDREETAILEGITTYAVSADGQKLLYQRGEADGAGWAIVDADGEPEPGGGQLDLAELKMKVDPAAEWRQIFREAWRFQRDYFYVDNVHGLDLDAAYGMYAPWVDHVRHRSDLTHVLDILGGETAVGHSFTGGGDNPDVETVPVGLLGADLEIDEGRYRLATIYTGENWNPDLRSPLSGPGIDAHEGDYLVGVNGTELTADINPYSLFDQVAGKQVVLQLNDRPATTGARDVTVVPVASELGLRRRAWVESNRRRVDEMSGGKLAYVWLPDTGRRGYDAFNRYYFAQIDKQGAVIDERFNGGGSIADYMIDLMSRTLMGYFNNPLGNRQPFTAPNGGIWGPKVLLINDAAGSGGDMLPYMFRLRKIGPLIGTRTWGGLVGIWDVPLLVDGGFITAPRGGFFNLDGEWDVEGKGVAPDIEVEQLPAPVAEGHDPQLEKGIEVALELLKDHAIRLKSQPPDPIRVRRPE